MRYTVAVYCMVWYAQRHYIFTRVTVCGIIECVMTECVTTECVMTECVMTECVMTECGLKI